jgi:two-component system, chemotaxis family, CheB/CheR fusion protein
VATESKRSDPPAPSPLPSPDPVAGQAASAVFPVIAVGASAGGLEAFEQLLRAMPDDTGMAFVMVQHLDPSHASILADILQRATRMPVVEAADQMPVLPNRVHVIPPNRDMGIYHGVLQLSVPTEARGLRMPIDAFMRALAEDRDKDAVGIVLSGTGTDGTLGLRAIFGAGGLCLVQDPATAKFDGMPESAIRAGYANEVLPPDKMAHTLLNRLRTSTAIDAPGPSATDLGKILMLLRLGTGHDFAQYKQSTIGRRIERRMTQNGIDSPELYARFLKEHPAELQTLFREMLINVTSFFRDPLAFVALKNDILPALLANKPAGYGLRVWVAGCATGEEAYSIAMVLRELIDEQYHDLGVQIYATDLDDEAIVAARTGLYPPNIAQDVSPERLRRFFREEPAGYRVRKEVRDMVVFAVQSVIKDPPFTRLDLLACRNLMIYLQPDLQDRLVPTFHYALKPGGVLFLSPSESIGSQADLFEPIDRKWKFFRARPSFSSTRAVLASGHPWGAAAAAGPRAAQADLPRALEIQVGDLARRALLQTFAPAAVVTDAQGNVLYINGETGKYLRPAPGLPSHNLIDMAREGLQRDLRDALRQASDLGQATLNRSVTLLHDGDPRAVELSVRLLPDSDAGHGLLMVCFQDAVGVDEAKSTRRVRSRKSPESQRVEALELELASAKETMTAMLEEQQASNEELKSANEEMQSTNEELQSTNEELETSKEELQSVNEEMMTVNAELQTKIEQMALMQDDMKNLLDNVRVGTIFLDPKLRIRRYTRDATRLYRLQATDVGRSLADIRSELPDVDLLADAQTVIDQLMPIEREVLTADGTWYLARLQPYRTVDNFIDGVVMTFVDVSDRVNAVALRKARDIAESIIDTLHSPLLVLDNGLRVQSANRAYFRAYGGTRDTVCGQPLFELEQARWDIPALRELLHSDAADHRRIDHAPLEQTLPDGTTQRLLISVTRVAGQIDQAGSVLLSIETEGAAAP